MAKVQRNHPCPCGSGAKAKRCCYTIERLSADAEVRRSFDTLCRHVAADLTDVDREEFAELFHEAIHLPEVDLSLQVRLPALSSPDIERARAALDGDDLDAFDEALFAVAETLDTPAQRLELARAILKLRDAGRVHPEVAAAAVFDLSEGESSAVFISSVAEAIGVATGDSRTPSGLIVAAA
jgi:SEC-C motif